MIRDSYEGMADAMEVFLHCMTVWKWLVESTGLRCLCGTSRSETFSGACVSGSRDWKDNIDGGCFFIFLALSFGLKHFM